MKKHLPVFALSILLWTSVIAAAAQCTASSGERRVPLLELYTSEGCDSCPPADRWLSSLPARGYGIDRVIALAFHVDYWNYLGWVDPFAQKRFTERQRHTATRNQSRVVYTPQFTLNGRDYRRGALRDDFGERIAMLQQEKPRASLLLALTMAPGSVSVSGNATIDAAERPLSQTWLALYENRLTTDVKAGENRGKQLEHDFVVRDIAGPLPVDAQGKTSLSHHFAVDVRWKPRDLAVAAFVQNVRTGDVLQALALGCAPPS
jgi:hypothetical protein